MKVEQSRWTKENGWNITKDNQLSDKANIVFVFGCREEINKSEHLSYIKSKYPKAQIIGCSTSGEICDTEVTDNCLVVTAVEFEKTKLETSIVEVEDRGHSFDAGVKLAKAVNKPGLKHLFVLSEGLNINGSELVKGIIGNLPHGVSVTGGLAGDGTAFQETCVVGNSKSTTKAVSALALYGNELKVCYASLGGWDSFGPERKVTKAEGNVLFELDGKPALEIYKSYLGDQAKGLPATGLLFPLCIRTQEGETGIVRTLLAIDESTQSMVFAGDLPVGCYARLMKANFDRLVDGAQGAAEVAAKPFGQDMDLAILISCVGRKLVLGQRTEEEVEAVREVVGPDTVLTGFYSYGEISPFVPDAKCELHNQTMTITAFSEEE